MQVHIGGIFQSDANRCFKAGLPKDVLKKILERLCEDLPFSSSVLSRRFSGPYAGCMELRFGDGWSLVYAADGESITLIRIGTEDEICQKS
jgi:mRNA-degrading endonuclease YafQ of YafQ-DinJ toxin-antitoxin module